MPHAVHRRRHDARGSYVGHSRSRSDFTPAAQSTTSSVLPCRTDGHKPCPPHPSSAPAVTPSTSTHAQMQTPTRNENEKERPWVGRVGILSWEPRADDDGAKAEAPVSMSPISFPSVSAAVGRELAFIRLPALQQIKKDFPYWEQLHGFWRTLPNFNPSTFSSEPGQNIAGQALALLSGESDPFAEGPAKSHQKLNDDDDDVDSQVFDLERTPERDQESQPLTVWSPSPKAKSSEHGDDPTSPPPKLDLKLTKKPLRNSGKANVLSSSSSASSVTKPRGKRSHAEAFAAETQKQNEILAALGKNKHDRRMAELSVKRQRLENDIQRENLAAEERRLAAEDRRREAEHKREREREQHQLMMMRMQLTMQNGNGFGGRGGMGNGGFMGGSEMDEIFAAIGDGVGVPEFLAGAGPGPSSVV
ncbi:hypothetical protein B0H11DRAFT_2230462 [Mycena galericulata]|nr:hypothetical protein B0H11DRAFT_2230462 [Mycena galericulata]